MLKIALQGLLLLAHRIPETLSLVILKMVTPALALATLPATTTTLQAGIQDRLHHSIQEWAVHPDKVIPLHTPRHNAHQDMKDMEVHQVLLVLLDITTTQDKEVLHQHGEDNMTRTLVHQRLEMTCTIEDGVEVVDIHRDRDIHKEVHQLHHQELLHHPTILQPPNPLINIRKVEWALEMGHNLGVPRAPVLRDPQVGCHLKAQG